MREGEVVGVLGTWEGAGCSISPAAVPLLAIPRNPVRSLPLPLLCLCSASSARFGLVMGWYLQSPSPSPQGPTHGGRRAGARPRCG